jgi:hypothetical protein
MKKYIIIGIATLAVIAVAVYFLFFAGGLKDQIAIPYISHQQPRLDPHVPGSELTGDKLDEALYDGLFNISANPSGITYEDGLGELLGINAENVVTVRLKPRKKWHSSYKVTLKDDEATVTPAQDVYMTAQDLQFTLRRIQRLGSLSPDYILIGQAVRDFQFSGPDANNEIRFQFHGERIWTEADIKEVLSFKLLPHDSELNAAQYLNGSGPYLFAGSYKHRLMFEKNPAEEAHLTHLILQPFIDNSTFATELKRGNINCLLNTPFGAVSPILSEPEKYFYKSNIATTFFALLYNVQRLSLEQRIELRKLIDPQVVVNRFFRVNTPQQRPITDYKGNNNNYLDYINYSIFPSTSYYVEEKTVLPLKQRGGADLSVLPDTIRVQTCLNYGFREELSELVEIMNDPGLFGGKIHAVAVQNDVIKRGEYDAVLVAFSGYRSNFLFDLYDVFLREPDFEQYKVNLVTDSDGVSERSVNPRSFESGKNFFRLDLDGTSPECPDFQRLLEYVYGFMSTREVGDKTAYAQFVDETDQRLALASWLFSLPSLAYFRTQFDAKTIDLYGVASQLSTIEKWQEKKQQ